MKIKIAGEELGKADSFLKFPGFTLLLSPMTESQFYTAMLPPVFSLPSFSRPIKPRKNSPAAALKSQLRQEHEQQRSKGRNKKIELTYLKTNSLRKIKAEINLP